MRFALIVTLGLGFLVQSPILTAQARDSRVDRIFAAYDKPGSPGCALGVVHDGNFIYRRGYGMGSLELGVPLSSRSVFYMGSVSKQFTAASVVLAAEQGLLSLDDDVRKYIPELPDYGRPITLRQMLHHTSGLRDFLTLLYLSGEDAADRHSRDEMMDLIVRQKGLNNAPGQEFLYSNTNYFLLGEVVRRATNKSLAEFAAANIFQPLGMAHTRFYDDHTLVVPGRVPAYYPGDKGDFLVGWSTNYEIVGAGGLMTSVDDLLLWDRNFYKNRLGKGTLLTEMESRGVLNNGKQIGYALGLEMGAYRGLPIVEHDGELLGYRTDILRFPEERFTVVCLCNVSSADTNSLARAVADVYLAKSLQPKAKETPQPQNGDGSPDPSRFAGDYLDPTRHFVFSVSAAGKELMAWGGSLQRIGPNQYRLGTGTITFDDSDGRMQCKLEIYGETFFAGKRIEEPRLNDADLASYSGRFNTTELDATLQLSINKGSLELRLNRGAALKLTPIARDEFQSDLGTIVFRRDEHQRVNGLRMFAVRARGLSFDKIE
jgi:CubicO group peptidase (beta-lactamase class C family)